MHDRTLLGSADVDNEDLTRMVADLLGHPVEEVELLTSTAEAVDYDLPAITTSGRYWVAGTARTPHGTEPFRIFVKHVQSWSRSPQFAFVPPEYREMAASTVPWRTEPLAYRSDLRDRLPDGLVMPRALGVYDVDDLSAAIWLEESCHPPVVWDLERYRRAAHVLGRMSGSATVAELGNVGQFEWSIRTYLFGRLGLGVLPVLRSEEIWHHPAIAATWDAGLRSRLLAAADRLEEYADELDEFPHVASHGDASPNNLLPGPTPDSFVLIDYGFWLPNPVGFDLTQLLVGDVQLGRRSPALLQETEDACLPAYVAGLAEEGLVLDPAVVRRSHALLMLIFTGMSALPFEQLPDLPPGEQEAFSADRAELARFSLDLVDATEG